jgi:hypothetical protein
LVWLDGNGPRVSGTSGYDTAADHFADLLEGAGYEVTKQPFAYDLWEELSDPETQWIQICLHIFPMIQLGLQQWNIPVLVMWKNT